MKSYILPRYVMRSALFAMLGAVVGLWVLQMVFAYLSELENISDTYTVGDALKFIMYRSAYFLVQFIPTGALLGAVVGLGLLAGSSELVSMRAAGMSKYRIIGWTMVPALLFVLISLGINQYVLPIANQKAQAVANHTRPTKLNSIDGYWSVLPKADGGQDIVYISYADSNGQLGETKRYHLDKHSNLTHAMTAKAGEYESVQGDEYVWQLNHTQTIAISQQGVNRTQSPSQSLALPIAPEHVHLLTREPADMSLTDLYAHQRLMMKQGIDSKQHRVAFWQKLLSPFSVLALVLVASSFVFGSLRSQSLGLRIVLALLTGLLFSYLTDLSGFVALTTDIPVIIMTLSPIIISVLAGMYMLNRQ